MSTNLNDTSRSTIIPSLRYRDAPAAIEWLCSVFGFAKKLVVPGEGNTIMHAQLTLDGGMVMLGSVSDGNDAYGKILKQPDEIGGCETGSACILVSDADAVYARVKQAGGEIELEIHDQDYGGRGFFCRDLEGHVWYVTSYNPWAGHS